MGRVSRYKKIKSFDPYSKKNGGKVDLSKVGIWGLGDNGRKPKKRSRRADTLRLNKKRKNIPEEGFDLPPSARDEFDLADMIGSVKKQRIETFKASPSDPSENRIQVNGNVATIPKTDKDEKRVARFLQVEKQLNEKVIKKKAEGQARIEGESKRAYARRAKAETRQIIKQASTEKNPEKQKRKKEFLNKKKKGKKKGLASSTSDPKEMDNYAKQDIELDGPLQPESIHFTEQAERPPTFKQLPRGAKERRNKATDKGKASGMTDVQIEAEKNAMELMRRKVHAQYASIKARRKRAGEFHL